eukprot:17174-Amphidinium_carterae.2
MPESARRQFETVTGEGLTISGWKEVTLVIGHMTMQIRFIRVVANVHSALLGLPDIDEHNVTVHTGKQPYLEKNGRFENLHPHEAHLHATAIVLPGLHTPNEVKIDMAVNTKYSPNKPTTIISPNKSCVGEVEDISQSV